MTPSETLKREQARAQREALEAALWQQIRAAKLDAGCVRQHQPFEDRRFAFDFAWPKHWVMVEVQGGIWRAKGAHNTGTAMLRDMEKHNRAAVSGWTVLQVAAEHIRSGQAIAWVGRALADGVVL